MQSTALSLYVKTKAGAIQGKPEAAWGPAGAFRDPAARTLYSRKVVQCRGRQGSEAECKANADSAADRVSGPEPSLDLSFVLCHGDGEISG